MNHFEKVKEFLRSLDYEITFENVEEELVFVSNEDAGIVNLLIDCEAPVLVIELFLFELKQDNQEVFKKLLQKNREVVHGAFALDSTGKKVVFRDSLQLENLDLNELEGSLNSISMMLSENYEEILNFSKQ